MKKKYRKSVFLGVIPARSGSKGIKNKNILRVAGKPLIAYTIRQAQSLSDYFSTIVSTDSQKIARVARSCGADVPFMRPRDLATDTTGMLAVLKHALQQYEKKNGVFVKAVVLLDLTAPVRKKQDIIRMTRIFQKEKPDLLVAVKNSHRNPYFNMLKIDAARATKETSYASLAVRNTAKRRQDAPRTYDITNTCWIFSRQAVLREQRIPKKTQIYEINDDFIDIDVPGYVDTFKYFLKHKKRSIIW